MNNASPGRESSALSFAFCACVLVIVLLLVSRANSFAASSFFGLKPLPGCADISRCALSRDGSTVVGESGSQAFRWTLAGGMVNLGCLPGGNKSHAEAVSRDGSVVVGLSNSHSGRYQGFRWTAAGGMVRLSSSVFTWGNTPKTINPVEGDRFESVLFPHSISDDGSVIVGSALQGMMRGEAFRWSASTGAVRLKGLSDSYCSSAYAVSGDGSVVVGEYEPPSGGSAFRWTASSGVVDLGHLPNQTRSIALAVSGDGSVVVGFSSGPDGCEAFRWTMSGGMRGLGNLPGGSNSMAYVLSGDGSIAGGYCSLSSGSHVFIWDTNNGMRHLQSVLADIYHLDLTGWKIRVITGVSDDGGTILGLGDHNGHCEAWIAHLDRPVNVPAAKGPGK